MTRQRHEPRFDDSDDAPPEGDLPAPARPPFGLGRFAVRAAAAAAVITVLSLYARETIRTNPPVPQREAEQPLAVAFVPAAALPVRPAVPLSESGPRLRLDAAEGIEVTRVEPARVNAATSQREASLSRGDFDAIEEAHLRVTLTQGTTADPAPSLFVTLARRAADGPGLSVTRTGERGRMASKFGAVETLETVLAGRMSRTCTGFVSLEAAPARLEGWLCAPLGQPPEPRALACALDALALDGHADPATEAVFREADVRRDTGCRGPSEASATGEALAEKSGQTGSIAALRRTPTKK
ncbi:hypothetical protein [Methylobacterium oxalidis]|uniref:Uncharacterized protein n=1 Tax=Methylobacterium oxalidis TaxID=944322 RepID=A0A512IWB4_9HYPH|nr:hypothetical protein [Methylobacterium oxalidis]GEP02007.1 hypothetical protein MOX02_00450 [Methylobacterium oxalidis]GJE30168.1 hypothetical protein LDDCCGHA_0331 [Methylobacterium oxalidis]GLS61952.1 hypothetical protein GCM10007888_03330 [Methylobacterium oxalidis]